MQRIKSAICVILSVLVLLTFVSCARGELGNSTMKPESTAPQTVSEEPVTTTEATTASTTDETTTEATTVTTTAETTTEATTVTTTAETTTEATTVTTTAAATTEATTVTTTAQTTTKATTTSQATTTKETTTAATTTSAPASVETPEIRLTSFDFAHEMGLGLNLGNTFDGYWLDDKKSTTGAQTIGNNSPFNYEKCWGAPITTQEMIDGIKKAGFNTVRIPVYWGNMMADDGKYIISKEFAARIKEVVGYCLKDDLYVVINMHHYDEFLIKSKSKDEFLKIVDILWTQIANEFKDYSDHLIFEGFNENVGSTRESDHFTDQQIYDYVNEINQAFVDTVRKTGGNNADRMLIISGYHTNIDATTDKRFKMPKDSASDRLMISVHYIDNICYWMNSIGNDYWLDYSKNQCELLKKAFTDKRIPVFVGEVSSGYPDERFASNAKYTDSSKCFDIMMRMALDYGFIPVIWDSPNDFYLRTDCKIAKDANQKVITKLNSDYFAD